MLLAVDTSTAQIGLGLYDGVQVLAESIWYSQRHHTTELAPAVAELLRHAGTSMREIEAVGVAIGPGSFTALRVGLAFVKGLALSRKLPLIGIPTLEILAAGQPDSKLPLVATLQAGRGRIAAQHFRQVEDKAPGEWVWKSQGTAEITTADALANSIEKPTLIAGELTAGERQRLAAKESERAAGAASAIASGVLRYWPDWRGGAGRRAAWMRPHRSRPSTCNCLQPIAT